MPQTEMELRDWQDIIEHDAARGAREVMLTAAHRPGQRVYEARVSVEDGPYQGMVVTARYTSDVCPECGGAATVNYDPDHPASREEKCRKCGGSGVYRE
jgi:predicted RNA-binding Zn-ribbon protein involved in translation (DUF1610 family)